MTEVFVVDAVRLAGGRRGGALAPVHPAKLAATVLDALVERNGIDGACIEDVMMGCVTQLGEQGVNIARSAVLTSTLPASVPAVTIDRQCGSSQQALHFAAQAIIAGIQDVVIAAGVESMSRVPMGSASRLARDAGLGSGPVTEEMRTRFGVSEFSQFRGAQLLADKYGLTRREMDEYALQSHAKAAAARNSGLFGEIVPVDVEVETGIVRRHERDEGIRDDASLEAIAAVKPLQEGGDISAANASQICDGASGVLLMSASAVRAHGVTPIARVHAMVVTAGDPVLMLEEPITAAQRILGRCGLALQDIDLFEVNEAFAAVPLAWVKALRADPTRLNVHGGAIALGHPLGASGTKLAATLIHALGLRRGRYGLQVMCEGGGLANATVFERL